MVDSCINPETRKPAVLEYSEQIGLSLERIKLIIATHWHDDHIRGLYEIVKKCPNADFFLSQAIERIYKIDLILWYRNYNKFEIGCSRTL